MCRSCADFPSFVTLHWSFNIPTTVLFAPAKLGINTPHSSAEMRGQLTCISALNPACTKVTVPRQRLTQMTLAHYREGSFVRPSIPDFVTFFNQSGSVSGITYGAEWSTTLLPGSWTPITDTPPQHTFSVPIGSNTRMFTRLKETSP